MKVFLRSLFIVLLSIWVAFHEPSSFAESVKSKCLELIELLGVEIPLGFQNSNYYESIPVDPLRDVSPNAKSEVSRFDDHYILVTENGGWLPFGKGPSSETLQHMTKNVVLYEIPPTWDGMISRAKKVGYMGGFLNKPDEFVMNAIYSSSPEAPWIKINGFPELVKDRGTPFSIFMYLVLLKRLGVKYGSLKRGHIFSIVHPETAMYFRSRMNQWEAEFPRQKFEYNAFPDLDIGLKWKRMNEFFDERRRTEGLIFSGTPFIRNFKTALNLAGHSLMNPIAVGVHSGLDTNETLRKHLEWWLREKPQLAPFYDHWTKTAQDLGLKLDEPMLNFFSYDCDFEKNSPPLK